MTKPIDTSLSTHSWFRSDKVLPDAMREVSVRGGDFLGSWTITGGVWWQPYKGQPHNKGRWMQKNGVDIANRLPESDEVEEWKYV